MKGHIVNKTEKTYALFKNIFKSKNKNKDSAYNAKLVENGKKKIPALNIAKMLCWQKNKLL